MANLNWGHVRVDFNDANHAMNTSSNSLSRAGTVFGELRKSILDEEQRAIDNAYREKVFDENVRQFGLEYALKEDQFREGIRQFDITSAETERSHRANEANSRASNRLAADRFDYEKQQNQAILDAYTRMGNILSGQADRDALAAHRKQYAKEYDIVDKANTDALKLSDQLVANRQAQAQIIEDQKKLRADKQAQLDKETKELIAQHPNIDTDIKNAEKAFNKADTDYKEALLYKFGTGYTKEQKDAFAQRRDQASTQLQALKDLKTSITKGAPQIGNLTTPELEKKMAQLVAEEEGILKAQQDMTTNNNKELIEARQKIKETQPALLRPQIMSNPALMFAYAAQHAPQIAPQMMDLWKTDMTQSAKAIEKQNDRAFQEHLARLKINEGRKTELLKLNSNIPSEVAKVNLDPSYAPYFQRIIQNALLFAEEHNVKVTPAEMVAVAKSALDVQKVPFRDQYETNSWPRLQRLVGGTGVLREQAATQLTDEMEDDQLQEIVNYILKQGLIQQKRAAKK